MDVPMLTLVFALAWVVFWAAVCGTILGASGAVIGGALATMTLCVAGGAVIYKHRDKL